MVFNEKEDELVIDVPKEKRYLNTTSYDYSVSYIYDLMRKGKIVLEVPFQRQFIWKEEKCSQLIESIIMNVPIPPLYLAEEEDGKWLVVDGLQRLNTIKTYYENEFSLKNLDLIKELNKSKYKDLPSKSVGLLDDGMLRVNVIKKDSHPDIKFDIFMRLNRGAVTLNYQELRNCLYRGKLNDAMKEIVSKNSEINLILGQKKPHPRYNDVELILRYFAISDNIKYNTNFARYEVNDYKGRMVTYLNEYIDKTNKDDNFSETDYINRFDSTIHKVVSIFGTDKAFRNIASDNNKIYKAIMDFIMPSFDKVSEDDLTKNKEKIIEILVKLLTSNTEFRNSITYRTSDKDVLNKRIDIWFKELRQIVSL